MTHCLTTEIFKGLKKHEKIIEGEVAVVKFRKAKIKTVKIINIGAIILTKSRYREFVCEDEDRANLAFKKYN